MGHDIILGKHQVAHQGSLIVGREPYILEVVATDLAKVAELDGDRGLAFTTALRGGDGDDLEGSVSLVDINRKDIDLIVGAGSIPDHLYICVSVYLSLPQDLIISWRLTKPSSLLHFSKSSSAVPALKAQR